MPALLIQLRILGGVSLMSLAIAGVYTAQNSGTDARFRGLCVVDAQNAWASGTGGTFVRTKDAGRTWSPGKVAGAETLDFRDVEAFPGGTAYLLASGEASKSRIYKSTDSGRSWTLQHTNAHPKGFLDALAFFDADRGLALGDPTEGRFTILATDDGGKNWDRIPRTGMPEARPSEGAFAASGTCLVTLGDSHAWFATGGAGQARVFRSRDRGRTWAVAVTPVRADRASRGIFSIGFRDPDRGIAVGGDYQKGDDRTAVVALTTDGGANWTSPKGHGPSGYRSAVAWVPGEGSRTWVAVGPTGADITRDDGETWTPVDPAGFHALAFSKGNAQGWAVGDAGKIASLSIR